MTSNDQTSINLAQQLDLAVGLHQRGLLGEAQAIYEALLRIDSSNADALHLLGVIAYQQGHFDKAVGLIGRAIAASPESPAFYANRGLALQELKQLDAATTDYGKAIALKPDYAEAYNSRAVAHQESKQLDAAMADYSMAIAIRPDYAEAYSNRGNALRELGKPEAAIADYDRAIAIRRDYAEAYNNRGNALRELGQLDAAIADYSKAIVIRPAYAQAHNNRGLALHAMKNFDAAIADYNKAIASKPDFAEAYNNRALAHRELRQLEAALADLGKAVAVKADYAEAYYNRGNALRELKQFEAATADYGKAVALKPDYAEAYNNRGLAQRELMQLDAAMADFGKAIALKPDLAETYFNRGNALRELNKSKAALVDYAMAVSVRPDYAEAYNNRGVAFKDLKQLDAAIGAFDAAIALEPDHAAAQWNKALVLLLRGDFAAGFELYEWRWKNRNLNAAPRPFARPLWLGEEPLEGKTILLYAEQGLGDTIQFCRYASLLARAGAQVIFHVPPPLVGLLKSLEGASQVLAEGEPLPDFDYHCPLMSLPLAFKTVLASIPDPSPYLHADPARMRVWQARIGERKNLKVGVVWNGGFRPNQPEIWAVNERRNISLEAFARALREVEVDFFSLQKGDPAESEIRGREAQYWPRGNFHNFASDIADFSDTAALVANLDLVVSVDTSTAHLAAALGKPTWILSRFDGCWRWLLEREDSPWYRSVRLYRQDDSQSWEPVLSRVAADLTRRAREPRT
jgi:tetratricopeptide (TPR) repeat protein